MKYNEYTGYHFIKKNKDFKYSDYFYKSIGNLLKNRTTNFTPILIDKIQFSRSCTYFSFYYFIKYKFREFNNNDHIFNQFINSSKETIINLVFNKNINIYYPLLVNSLYLIKLNNDNINSLKRYINNNIIVDKKILKLNSPVSNISSNNINKILYIIHEKYNNIIKKLDNNIDYEEYISLIYSINEYIILLIKQKKK